MNVPILVRAELAEFGKLVDPTLALLLRTSIEEAGAAVAFQKKRHGGKGLVITFKDWFRCRPETVTDTSQI